ncbi:MAG TPA: FAD-dependent oxidoreductase [Sorangium sp.]|nr:FAD-dependent oxidoreductase [Sorangium sp.]
MSQPYKFTSHEGFAHDSLDSLGYDWERIGAPQIKPRYPFKIYLPMTTDDIVLAVKETRSLGQKLMIRSKGHSSNDLVLADRGCVLVIEKLNRILDLNEAERTVTVQAGVVLAELDLHLADRGYGLPIIGDHNHITAGGFASVGGISPASHRFGMFVDNVRRLEYVNHEGEVVSCGRNERPDEFYRVLAGAGQHGVIATLTLDVIRIDKFNVILQNDRRLYADLKKFLDEAGQLIRDPGQALMERGVWLDYAVLGTSVRIGQFSSYHEAPQSPLKSLWNKAAYGYLQTLGLYAGRLPTGVDQAVKYLGMAGVVLSPRYASTKNIETFTDRILDSSVGDPTRMFIVLGPAERFAPLFNRLYSLFLEYRLKTGCFTFIAIYVKAIRSDYLANGDPSKRFCELMLYCGIDPDKMTEPVLEEIVSQIDDVTIAFGAYRYMHTKTVKDEKRRSRIDPNAVRASLALPHSAGTNGTHRLEQPDAGE